MRRIYSNSKKKKRKVLFRIKQQAVAVYIYRQRISSTYLALHTLGIAVETFRFLFEKKHKMEEKKQENPLKRNFEDICSEAERMDVEKKKKKKTEEFIPRE